MQVVNPSALPMPHAISPSKPGRGLDSFGSTDLEVSPMTPSRRRLRRSLRLSGASLSSPQNALNKENVVATSLNQPSTSAKALDAGRSDNGALSSPRTSSPLTCNISNQSSPRRSRSLHKQNSSPLRRTFHSQIDHNVSSSDESDDSALVFFGKPSSAEKKKRMHYEQRVLEKRLKHKDSLDLARRRPISFNPDDTMLVDDQHTHGWSWSRPTPTPSRPSRLVLSSAAASPGVFTSPTKSLGTVLNSSPEPLGKSSQTQSDAEDHTSSSLAPNNAADASPGSEPTVSMAGPSSAKQAAAESLEGEVVDSPQSENSTVGKTSQQQDKVNPFAAPRRSPEMESAARRSPSKQRTDFPQRDQSPVRSVETLIGAAMARNKDLISPSRSPRRSPRLSLRALQLSVSPTKGGSGLLVGTSTPFQQPATMLPSPQLQQSTPFQRPATAQPVPPSTGLSRFACLQNLSPINGRVLATPGHRAVSMQMAQQATLPSPFIAAGPFQSTFTVPVAPAPLASPSRSPSRPMRLASPAKHAAHSLHDRNVVDSRNALSVPGTPSVRFALPEVLKIPGSVDGHDDKDDLKQAQTPSPTKSRAAAQDAASPLQATLAQTLTSPERKATDSALQSLSTPPSTAAAAKPETPGPVFRQTARRVPIQQHEAEFGVKVSPEKPSYSPRRAYANSSARTQDYGMKTERVPARRVAVLPTAAARQASGKVTLPQVAAAPRVASVASKAARTVSTGASRIGSQTSSLPATALSRFASSSHASTSTAATSVKSAVQPVARSVSSMQGSSVASKASRLQRPASAAFGDRPNSPSKQARSLSGLPRPRSAQPTISSAPTSAAGSRLPRPATIGHPATATRPTSRPVPMSVGRLATSQQGRTPAVSAASREEAIAEPVNSSSAESSPASEPAVGTLEGHVETNTASEGLKEVITTDQDTETVVTSMPAPVQGRQPVGTLVNSGLRRQASASALRDAVREAASQTQPIVAAEASGVKTSNMTAVTGDDDLTRSSSPTVSATALKPPSPLRSAPSVVLDAEQQRLRCLAMQVKARNRMPKGSNSSAPTSSDADELPSSEPGNGSPPSSNVEQSLPSLPGASAPTAVEALAAKHAEAVDAASNTCAPSNRMATASAVSSTSSAGRPLRSARTASRTLTPSATRVPPARGRALSLNDIIAARKIDVPLSLTDQLKLADTVNKKYNEKTLARYKVTKIQRPYERPPSPDRHDHEPEACTIVEDLSSHRQGKGDHAPYSTPPKSSSSSTFSSNGRKSVRWYRPLFVGQGAQYGTRACEVRPALKQINYELDKLGNKVATGCSPKLLKGHAIVIYRNYFQGEPEPLDD